MTSLSKKSSKSTKPSSSSSRTPTKRILTELSAYASSNSPCVAALAPVSPSNVLSLRAILTGSHLPSTSPYHNGRWLLSITVPENYPIGAPEFKFVTRICHPNVKWETGEICLDLLGANWTPILGVMGGLEAVSRLLGEPGLDSPLAVEIAALERQGDSIGARGLVGFWCAEERWEGGLEEEVQR